ncbi:O-antigen ligase family protein [Clostridium perfringens]
MFVFIPYYYKNYNNIDFKKCTYYLSIGIITACISSQILINIPHMLNYISVDSIKQINLTRLNGFYGDANFYSAQILVAISGILLLISKDNNNNIQNFIILILLLFFGLQSVSKMFLITTLIMFIIWVILFLLDNKSINNKITIIFIIIICSIIILFTGIFNKQIDYYMIRFNMVTDSNSLTTGRTEIFKYYFEYFNNNILSFITGVGLSNVYVNNRASHNTLIQIIFQLGILGSLFLVLWIKLSFYNIKYNENQFNKYVIVLFIGCFISWMSLDMLMFDEFFYFILFFYTGKDYLNEL